jgi:hypothetical protein
MLILGWIINSLYCDTVQYQSLMYNLLFLCCKRLKYMIRFCSFNSWPVCKFSRKVLKLMASEKTRLSGVFNCLSQSILSISRIKPVYK